MESNTYGLKVYGRELTVYKILFVLIIALTCTYKIGIWQIDEINNILALSTIIFSLLSIFILALKNKNILGDTKYEKNSYKIFFIFFMIQIVLEVYSIILVLLHKIPKEYISTNIQSILIPIYFVNLIILFKQDAIKIFTYGLLCSFYICMIVNLVCFGPKVFIEVFNVVFLDGSSTQGSRAFEVHNNSFAAGVLLIYHLFCDKKNKNKIILFSLALMVLLGQKRIEFMALFVVVLLGLIYKFIYNKFESKILKFIIMFVNVLILFICYVYVYMSISGELTNLLIANNINTMGRNYYYELISRYSNFSISYLGNGRNSTSYILGVIHASYGVRNLHNDLLKMYFESGFILFTIWIIIYLIFIPKFSYSKSSIVGLLKNSLLIYFMIICFTTDNVEVYLTVQVAFMLCLSQNITDNLEVECD